MTTPTTTNADLRAALTAIGAIADAPHHDGVQGRPRSWLWDEFEWRDRLGVGQQAARNWLTGNRTISTPILHWILAAARVAPQLDLDHHQGVSLYQRMGELIMPKIPRTPCWADGPPAGPSGHKMIILAPPPPMRHAADLVYPGDASHSLSRLAHGLGMAPATLRCHAAGVRQPCHSMLMIVAVAVALADVLRMQDRPARTLIADAVVAEVVKSQGLAVKY